MDWLVNRQEIDRLGIGMAPPPHPVPFPLSTPLVFDSEGSSDDSLAQASHYRNSDAQPSTGHQKVPRAQIGARVNYVGIAWHNA